MTPEGTITFSRVVLQGAPFTCTQRAGCSHSNAELLPQSMWFLSSWQHFTRCPNPGWETLYHPQVKKSGPQRLPEVTVPELGSQILILGSYDCPTGGLTVCGMFLIILCLQGSAQSYFTLPPKPFHMCLKQYDGQLLIILGQME